MSTPMRLTRSGCAPAASGHAAAAPPSAASNSRRPMVTVIRPSRARCVREGYHATSVQSWRSRRAGCCLLSSEVESEKARFSGLPRRRTYLPILELLPPPALRERSHRGLARHLVAVHRLTIFVGQDGGCCFHDAADD